MHREAQVRLTIRNMPPTSGPNSEPTGSGLASRACRSASSPCTTLCALDGGFRVEATLLAYVPTAEPVATPSRPWCRPAAWIAGRPLPGPAVWATISRRERRAPVAFHACGLVRRATYPSFGCRLRLTKSTERVQGAVYDGAVYG